MKIEYYMDGDKWCCVDQETFIDIQASPIGFGDTQQEAFAAWLKDSGHVVISAAAPPDSGTDWERGKDPWHHEAFEGIPTVEEQFGAEQKDAPRSEGWYQLDWVGNQIGFIADGTIYKPREVA